MSERDLTEHELTHERLADGDFLKVWRDTVRLPDGSTGVREYIRHPGASVLVPLTDDGQVLMVRQFRYPLRRTFLELPAGKLDPGETPLQTAHRELEEETGHRAGRLTLLTHFHPSIGFADEVMHLYLARDLTPTRTATDDDEFLDLVRLPFDDAVRLALTGELTDMKTMLGLLLAREHLARPGA